MSKTKCVWVTGTSSGIGKSAAIAFAEAGYQVAATARNREKLEELAAQYQNISVYTCDMSEQEEIQQCISEIEKTHTIEIFINNAGMTTFTLAEDDSPALVRKIIDTNLTGAITAIQSVLPGMISRKSGIILNILSVITKKIFTKSSIYAATKSGLEAYANVLREEVRSHRIKVINVYPGATDTPIWSDDMRNKYAPRMMSPEAIGKLLVTACSLEGNMVAEEIVLRPPTGDL